MFVPTLTDAKKVCEQLEKLKIEKDGYRPFCVELSGKVPDENKEYAIHVDKYKEADGGPYTRKVVSATNIAESSITIDGAAYVIDSGYELNVRYNPFRDSTSIEKSRISKAQAKQRWGRVGRRDEGKIICLYTEEEYKDFEEFPDPKLLNQNLENLILSLSQIVEPDIGEKRINLKDVVEILDEFISPPQSEFIETATDNLKIIGCLDENQYFTPVAKLLNKLQIQPRNGRIILESIIYNKRPMGIRLASILSTCGSLQSIVGFSNPDNYKNDKSDVLTIQNVYNSFSSFSTDEEKDKFCADNKFNYDGLNKIDKMVSFITERLDKYRNNYQKINILKALNMKDNDLIKYDSSNDTIAHLILSGNIMNLSKKIKGSTFRNCVPNIIDSFTISNSPIKTTNMKYILYGSIVVFNESINFGIFTSLSDEVIKNLKKRLNNTYIQCLQEEGYTKKDLENFKKRLQITDDFNDDHIPELNITELKNFVSSEIDTDWSLFWPLYISPDLLALPRLSQLLRQFNRDAADVGTLNDDLIFGTEIISQKASDTINLIKIITGSYEKLLDKYNKKLEEVESKEKAVDKLHVSLYEIKGQFRIINSKLDQNRDKIRNMQLKLNTLDMKNKDDTHTHSKFLKSVINLEKIILPKSELSIKNLTIELGKETTKYEEKKNELIQKQEEVQIVEDALNMMKTKLQNIISIKGGGIIAENVVNQLGGFNLKKLLKTKMRTILKPLSNNKIIFTPNEELFKKFDNEEIINLLKYNKVNENYIHKNDRKKLTSLLKILVLTKLQKINNKKRLIDLAKIINYKNIENQSGGNIKERLSKIIKF